MEIPKLKLRDLQPSQFYISAGKLKTIECWLGPKDLSGFQPIPVKLLTRIIPEEDYREKWDAWCDIMNP